MDITNPDPVLRRGFDFNRMDGRNRAVHRLPEESPYVLIASPMCTAFSTIMSLNDSRMSKEEKERILRQARVHLEFTMKLIMIQHGRGGYFVFEHPAGATSWQESSVQKVLKETGATVTTFDQCQFGLTTTVNCVTGPARTRTKLMSTMASIGSVFNKLCDGSHAHFHLEAGRPKTAQ